MLILLESVYHNIKILYDLKVMIVPTTINDFVYYVNVLILKLEQNRIVTQERTVSLSFIVLSA